MGVISKGLSEAKQRTIKITDSVKSEVEKSEENARRLLDAKRKMEGLASDSHNYDSDNCSSDIVEKKEKLYVAGRANRKEFEYVTKGFYILKSLDEQVKEYCSGGDVAVYNKLIDIGLEVVKSSQDIMFSNVSDLEKKTK